MMNRGTGMGLRSTETVIRMGPITVISLLIIIALTTLGILSLTTARASNIAAEKQSAAIQALYENEVQGQIFLSDLDAVLQPLRAKKSDRESAMAALSAASTLEGATIDGITVQRTFENEARKLNVVVAIREDLEYQVVAWKTESNIDTSETVELWQGSEA